mgnify:FL=1
MEYPGAIYHVIQRGNNREFILDRPENRDYLVNQIIKAVKVDGIEVFAYVVMSNHYHLLLRTGEEPLSKVMHRINTCFSKYYNRKMDRTGHVFGGRYKSIPVQDDNYLLMLVRYIHRNPVRAGLCSDMKDYRWSSDHHYRSSDSSFVNSDLLFDILANDRLMARKEYDILMTVADDTDCENIEAIGDEAFAQMVKTGQVVSGIDALDEILCATGVDQEQFREIKNGSRKRVLTPFKVAYAREAIRNGHRMVEIARHINISATAINKLCQAPK